MPARRFTFARFEPHLWQVKAGPVDNPMPIVLDIEVPAPDGAQRDTLRTKIVRRAESPNPAFRSFVVSQDEYASFLDYKDANTDETIERTRTYPATFQIHELHNFPGAMYANVGVSALKEVLRRYRESTGKAAVVLHQRIVRLEELERLLKAEGEVSIQGYVLLNVRSTPPIDRLAADGANVDTNAEVVDAKRRAEGIHRISFDLVRDTQVLGVRVGVQGDVRFMNYPGDAIALGALAWLDDRIDRCSDQEGLTVRPRRG